MVDAITHKQPKIKDVLMPSPFHPSRFCQPYAAPFNNRAGTLASFGYGWTFDYDISFLPFDGVQKRLIMPGGRDGLVGQAQKCSGRRRN